MKRMNIGWFVAAVEILTAAVCQAAIMGSDSLDIDFTKPEDARAKASWGEIGVPTSQPGDSSSGYSSGWHDAWIRTKPVGIAFAGRPSQGMGVRVEIQPPAAEVTLPGGHKVRNDGKVYVRHSPDLKHWSSWHLLTYEDPNSKVPTSMCAGNLCSRTPDGKIRPGRFFSGVIQTPHTEFEEYHHFLLEYAQGKIVDEEAAVRWILRREPELFARHIPFIGHVEFLFEGGPTGHERDRIQSFHARMSWLVSGIGGGAGLSGRPWRFVADEPRPATAPASEGPSPVTQPAK